MTTIARPDILIRSPQWYPIAVVEVKNLPNFTRDEAKELRRNLIEYGVPARVPYFLLLSEDVGFLWTEAQQMDPDAPPAYEFPMENMVTRYWKRNPERRLYREVLELVTLQWLTDLTVNPQGENEEPEKTLARAGFNESIRGATVLLGDEL